MPVHREKRSELREKLRRLVDGEITNDDFDDYFGSGALEGDDPALPAIGQLGWGLYSDTSTYKLTGASAVRGEARDCCDRALLFLTTDLEYEWPEMRCSPPSFWAGPAMPLLVAVIFVVTGYLRADGVGALLLFVGLLCSLIPVHWLATYAERRRASEAFRNSGDFDAWPFLRRSDLERRREHSVSRDEVQITVDRHSRSDSA